MKKLKLLIGALLSSTLLSIAADVQSLVVQPKSGSESVTALSNVQRITFSGTSMTVIKKDATQNSYAISNVQKLLFGLRNATTDLAKVETPNVKAYPNPTSDILFVEGVSKVESLRLFNLAGIELSVSTTLLSERLQLNISGLPQGFYLLQINNQTIKIQKQ